MVGPEEDIGIAAVPGLADAVENAAAGLVEENVGHVNKRLDLPHLLFGEALAGLRDVGLGGRSPPFPCAAPVERVRAEDLLEPSLDADMARRRGHVAPVDAADRLAGRLPGPLGSGKLTHMNQGRPREHERICSTAVPASRDVWHRLTGMGLCFTRGAPVRPPEAFGAARGSCLFQRWGYPFQAVGSCSSSQWQ